MVLITHVGFQSGNALAGPFAGPLARLDAGVAVFFVISGFLLFRPHVVAHLDGRPAPQVRVYLWHRALRILPVLWMAVTYAAVLVPTEGAPASAYFQHATLTHIYFTDQLLTGLTQMWSLATEVAFYLVLPLLGAVLCSGRRDSRWARRTVLILGAVPLASALWMLAFTVADVPRARLWLPGMAGWFALGMLLAVLECCRRRQLLMLPRLETLAAHPGTAWSLAAAVFMITTTPLGGPLGLAEAAPGEAAFKHLTYGIVASLLVLPAVIRRASEDESTLVNLLSGRVATFLGEISYGIFAYHVIVLALVERVLHIELFSGQFWLRLLLTLLSSVVIAAISFYWMERPIMQAFRHRESASPVRQDAPARPTQ